MWLPAYNTQKKMLKLSWLKIAITLYLHSTTLQRTGDIHESFSGL